MTDSPDDLSVIARQLANEAIEAMAGGDYDDCFEPERAVPLLEAALRRQREAGRHEGWKPGVCPMCDKQTAPPIAICSDEDHDRILICQPCAEKVGEFFGWGRKLRQAEAQVASLREALRQYGQHHEDCAVRWRVAGPGTLVRVDDSGRPCSCGFDAALGSQQEQT